MTPCLSFCPICPCRQILSALASALQQQGSTERGTGRGKWEHCELWFLPPHSTHHSQRWWAGSRRGAAAAGAHWWWSCERPVEGRSSWARQHLTESTLSTKTSATPTLIASWHHSYLGRALHTPQLHRRGRLLSLQTCAPGVQAFIYKESFGNVI